VLVAALPPTANNQQLALASYQALPVGRVQTAGERWGAIGDQRSPIVKVVRHTIVLNRPKAEIQKVRETKRSGRSTVSHFPLCLKESLQHDSSATAVLQNCRLASQQSWR
jgi:hypothetical protein